MAAPFLAEAIDGLDLAWAQLPTVMAGPQQIEQDIHIDPILVLEHQTGSRYASAPIKGERESPKWRTILFELFEIDHSKGALLCQLFTRRMPKKIRFFGLLPIERWVFG
jgi:hypothetical protein